MSLGFFRGVCIFLDLSPTNYIFKSKIDLLYYDGKCGIATDIFSLNLAAHDMTRSNMTMS